MTLRFGPCEYALGRDVDINDLLAAGYRSSSPGPWWKSPSGNWRTACPPPSGVGHLRPAPARLLLPRRKGVPAHGDPGEAHPLHPPQGQPGRALTAPAGLPVRRAFGRPPRRGAL